MPRGMNKRTDDERWELAKTNYEVTETGCWRWLGFIDKNTGYGQLGRNIRAHRFFYERMVGPIPDGLHLDHLCRVRACVNAAHLEPVTCRENLLRGVGFSAQNAAKTHCATGHLLDDANTYYRPDRLGRMCRECRRVANNRFSGSRREEKAAYCRAWRARVASGEHVPVRRAA